MELKEYCLNYLDMHHDKLSIDFIVKYITMYAAEHNLLDYINQITFNQRCSYNEELKLLYINPNFTHNATIELQKTTNEKDKNKLNNLMFIFMLNHELTHIIQAKVKKENLNIDYYFTKELIKSEIIAEKDIKYLNRMNYDRYHDCFLFESHANMNAIIEMNNLLKELNDNYPKEIYNIFATKVITIPYYDDLYPIKSSNRVYNKIIKDLKEFDNNQFNSLKYELLKEPKTPNYSLEELMIYGYPIPNETYQHFIDIRKEKKKVKTLF